MEIHGLTPKQKMIAKILWNCDTLDEVTQFISTLRGRDLFDAQSLAEIMIIETVEPMIERHEDEVKALLERM